MTKKSNFSERSSWLKFTNLGLALGMALKFYTSVAKGMKFKDKKFWGLIHTIAEVTGEKLVTGARTINYKSSLSYIIRKL